MNIDEIKKAIQEMQCAFSEVQMPRTPFVLEHFVVGQHDTESQQYAQCVVELQIKYDAIRRAMLHQQKLMIEIERLEQEDDELSRIDADLKRIDIEEQERAMCGARREFEALYRIWKSFPHQYTRQELDAAQEEYWVKRLTRQAHQDLLATGRVNQGNQEALKQIGRAALPQLDHVREVEQRYLETGDVKILIAVPTEEKAVDGLPCLEGLIIPSGVQAKYYNVWGKSAPEAYNDAVMVCLNDGADFMLTVEDDTFPPPDALVRLLAHLRTSDNLIIGAWYPKRNEAREGAPIVLRDGKRQALSADGEIHKVYTLPMGCTLFPAQVFLKTNAPWFVSTGHLTQDSFFSQKAREAGYRLLCDTSIRCRHVDRETGETFAAPELALVDLDSKVVLNAGCGQKNPTTLHPEFHKNDWKEIRLDINPQVNPDIVADIIDMSMIDNDAVDAIWSSHNLEHLYAHEVVQSLSEFYRVLKPGGFVFATLPDLRAVCQHVASKGDLESTLYVSPAGPISAMDVIFGHRPSIAVGNTSMAHKTGFTSSSLRRILTEAGFEGLKIWHEELALWVRAYKPERTKEG